jgi:rhamnose transport system permease protein
MSKLADTISAPASRTRSGSIGRLSRAREFRLVIAHFAIGLAVTLREPRFLKASNLEQVALSATLLCIVAIGEALVIIARQVDLSVGAIVAMSAFVSASWLEANPNGPLVFAFLIGCGVGLAMGGGNALLVALFRIPAIVATLGTLAVYRGGVIVYAGGRQISATVLPDSYGHVAEIAFSWAFPSWFGSPSRLPSSSASSHASPSSAATSTPSAATLRELISPALAKAGTLPSCS